jgi:hypothetical protein
VVSPVQLSPLLMPHLSISSLFTSSFQTMTSSATAALAPSLNDLVGTKYTAQDMMMMMTAHGSRTFSLLRSLNLATPARHMDTCLAVCATAAAVCTKIHATTTTATIWLAVTQLKRPIQFSCTNTPSKGLSTLITHAAVRASADHSIAVHHIRQSPGSI